MADTLIGRTPLEAKQLRNAKKRVKRNLEAEATELIATLKADVQRTQLPKMTASWHPEEVALVIYALEQLGGSR